MTGAELLANFQRQIPLTIPLGVGVRAFSAQEVVLTAPLEPNHNHVGTVFGGSLYAIAALACYGIFRAISAESGIENDNLVIQEGSIKYLAPVSGNFEARSLRPAEGEVQSFLKQLKTRGRARLVLRAALTQDGAEKAIFEGVYVFIDR